MVKRSPKKNINNQITFWLIKSLKDNNYSDGGD